MGVLRRLGGAAGALLGATIVASLLTAGVAQAATTYVVDNTNTSCSDTGAGSLAQPFCTIAAAAKKAVAGDTVQVNGGPYAATSVDPANSGTAGNPITFTAGPGVTISGGAAGTRGFSISSRNYIVINGFTITTTSSYGIYVAASTNISVTNNTVSFAGQPTSATTAMVGIYLNGLTGGTVSGNLVHDNSAHGIQLTSTTTGVTVQGNTSYHNAYQWQRNANGIYVQGPGNSIIGNVTYGNEDSGIGLDTSANNSVIADNVSYDNGDHGIDNRNVTGGVITGNTVYFNCTDGINVEGTGGSYVIENNIAVDNATGAIINPTPINPTGAYSNLCNRRTGNIGVYDSAPASTKADYNLVWQDGAGVEYEWAGTSYATQAALTKATGQEAHGIFANPKFANATAFNLQLTEGSPAIDSADSGAPAEQPTDILGKARMDDPIVPNTGAGPRTYDDRGAYEFQSTAPPPPTPAVAIGAKGTDGQLWVQTPQLGAGWHPLGGVIAGPPAVVAPPNPNGTSPAVPLFIGTGTDKHLWIRSATVGWQPIGAALCIGSPGAVAYKGTLTVACRGTDNALWYNSVQWPGTGVPTFPVAGWKSLGGVLSAGPAVAPVGTTVTFFVRGTNGRIFTRTATTNYVATPWSCIGAPAAAQQAASGVTTFACQGTNRALWEATNPGTGWNTALSLGGVLLGGPAVAATSQQTEFFAEGSNHAVFQNAAGVWASLGGVVLGGVGASALN